MRWVPHPLPRKGAGFNVDANMPAAFRTATPSPTLINPTLRRSCQLTAPLAPRQRPLRPVDDPDSTCPLLDRIALPPPIDEIWRSKQVWVSEDDFEIGFERLMTV